jgi:hypothetical protein
MQANWVGGWHRLAGWGVMAAVTAGMVTAAAAQAKAKAALPPDAMVIGGQPPSPAAPKAPPPKPAVKLLPNPSPARIQQIIQTFTTNEKLFRHLLSHNYVYTESIDMQELDSSGNPVGSYRQVNDINYDPYSGQRQIICTFCPQPSLRDIEVTEDDITDMFDMNMYTLSVDQLPQYNITYVDHQPLDEITAYVFDVAPKKIVKGQRYFDGRVYVDDHDLMIVKSVGRVVPNQYDKHGNPTNTFLPFTVWRQKIDNKYWFPVYTLMQGSIPGGPGVPAVPMKMVIQFTNYKQFRASARILSVQALPPGGAPAAGKKKPTKPTIPH